MKQILDNYGAVELRKEAWNRLLEKGKIPSIGGEIVIAKEEERKDENLTLSYDELSPRAKQYARKITIDGKEIGVAAARTKRYKIIENKQVFNRFSKGVLKHRHDDAQYLGDSLDRELIARYQMHQGGLYQFIRDGGPRDPDNAESFKGTGIPDILVTNYSMMEYMLMRPLEHVFWHKTGNWLRNCERNKANKNDPQRRRLLMVIDEAHLYQGAMGTEFSQLLRRLVAVLNVDISQLQFIITSASLGGREELARKYASELLTINEDKLRTSKIQLLRASRRISSM